MLCNNRGNDWSKLTAQLATYPLVKCPLLHTHPSATVNAHEESDRNTEETSAVDRLFSGRVLCRGKHEQTVLAARTAEGRRTSGAAIKGNKGFFDGARANNLKSCLS